jgi:hypothetical protein
VTRVYAEQQAKEFNEYFEAQDQATKDMFGNKPSTVSEYEGCFVCGLGATFRPFKEGDCPDGCTIQPTIYED